MATEADDECKRTGICSDWRGSFAIRLKGYEPSPAILQC